jgi:hypothetical protein
MVFFQFLVLNAELLNFETKITLHDTNVLLTQNDQSRRLGPRINQPVVQYFHRAPSSSKSSSSDRKLLVSAACFLTARAAALLIFTSPIKHRKAFPKRRKGFSRERYLYGKKDRALFFPFSGRSLLLLLLLLRPREKRTMFR